MWLPLAEASSQESQGLLIYDVKCAYCTDEIHVFNYMAPQSTLNCFSPLASLITQYNYLLSMRQLNMRAMEINSKINVVMEEGEKTMLNSMAEAGAPITYFNNSMAEVSQAKLCDGVD
jgi:hypothetical protein